MAQDKRRLLTIWHLLNREIAILRDRSDTPPEMIADVLQAQQLIHRVLREYSATDDPGGDETPGIPGKEG